jgi:hypothetical protein
VKGLEIRAIMNSSVEDIFAFKTCCGMRVYDQNLEIQITNHGSRPVTVPSLLDLKVRSGLVRIENLMPHGDLVVEPGETKAFYCSMDEDRWLDAEDMILYDEMGNSYEVKAGRNSPSL